MTPSSLSIIIPVFNEAGGLPGTIDRFHQTLKQNLPGLAHEMIIVDDASTDGSTRQIPADSAIRVIRHSYNRGYGAALKTGIQAAKYDAILICDADGSYSIEDLSSLIAPFEESMLVVAQRRAIVYPHWMRTKVAARRLLKIWLRVLTGVDIPDINSGFRLFSRSRVLSLLPQLSDRFSFTTGLTMYWIYSKYPITYVPTNYASRVGQSKVRFIRDGIRLLRQTGRIAWACRARRVLGLCLLFGATAIFLATVFAGALR